MSSPHRLLPLVLWIASLVAFREWPADAQESQAVFRAEAYVVTQGLTLLDRQSKPMTGLTDADFSITIDKNMSVAVGVAENPTRSGSYLLSFNPPATVRDGKKHHVQVKVKSNGRWATLRLNWRLTFDKASPAN